jgi:hypothetical protein
MLRLLWFLSVLLTRFFRSRRDLLLENLALRQQLAVLKRLMFEYVRYYHKDRTHLALAKGTPAGRHAKNDPRVGRRIASTPRLGGLHHRYGLAA